MVYILPIRYKLSINPFGSAEQCKDRKNFSRRDSTAFLAGEKTAKFREMNFESLDIIILLSYLTMKKRIFLDFPQTSRISFSLISIADLTFEYNAILWRILGNFVDLIFMCDTMHKLRKNNRNSANAAKVLWNTTKL